MPAPTLYIGFWGHRARDERSIGENSTEQAQLAGRA
jgi:hypothetical protein